MIKICHGTCRTSSTSSLRKDKELAEVMAKRLQPQAKEGLSLSPADSRTWIEKPHVHVAAIDNSLSFPIHHPNSWRSYCYGWLFLPSSLIGLPFSRQTRDHFLPVLTSPMWWAQTVFELRRLFSKDDDFSEKMFKRQMSVLKGQAWNIVMSLRDPDAGPLELCRRTPCIVHDDEVTVADDVYIKETLSATALDEDMGDAFRSSEELSNPRPSIDRNQSVGGDRPSTPTKFVKPTVQRHSSERPVFNRPASPGPIHFSPRPMPVSKHVDLTRTTFGDVTGVSLMEHMERLQMCKQEEDHARLMRRKSPNELGESETAPLANDHESMRGSSRFRKGMSLDLEREIPHRHDGRVRSGSIDDIVREAMPRFETSSPSHHEVAAQQVVIVEVCNIRIQIDSALIGELQSVSRKLTPSPSLQNGSISMHLSVSSLLSKFTPSSCISIPIAPDCIKQSSCPLAGLPIEIAYCIYSCLLYMRTKHS